MTISKRTVTAIRSLYHPALLGFALLVFASTLVAGSTASAQDVGPTAPSALSGIAGKLNPANWKMPSFGNMMMPAASEKDRIIERKDSLVTEVTGTAKNSWNRTKSALNPMKLLPASSRTPSKEAKKPGFFSRLFSPPAPKNQASSVNEYLKQDRLKP